MFAGSPTSYASGYLELLIKGIYLEKVNSQYSKDLYKFQVDEKGIFLRYQKVSRFKWSKQDDSDILETPISEIKEIRKGVQTDVFCEVFKGQKRQMMESLCCSLLLSDGKTLDLRTNREEVRNAFFECVHYLKNRQSRDLWYKEQFLKADKNRDNCLSIKEIVQLLNQLNIDVDEFYAALLLQKKSLDLDEFIELLRRLQSRKSIEEIFRKYAGDKDSLSAEDLHRMFTEQQHENKSLSECESIINSFEGYQKYRAQKCLTMDGFHQLFNSKFFDIFNSECLCVYQDMNHPITHYFIDSSHNTYLGGGQINSYSRVECYVNVLRAGCRCVEIDVWDGNDNDPVVTHGYAGTTKLLFSDVIDAIDETAFCSSKYPVILSLENHCNVDQQRKMAKIMKDIFKDKIFVGPINEESCPSPEHLIGKIIVKCKKLEMLKSLSSVESDEPMNEYDSVDAKQRPVKLAKELSDLVAICQPAKFSSFQHSAINHNFKNVCSLDENKARNLAQNNMQEFIAHNMRILSRIYPSGTRIKSSNYDPTIFWLAGCQLVALNHQTSKQPMFLNRGMFSDNGGCGYILKPKYQRNEESLEEFFKPKLLNLRRNYFITIIDGFSLPKKPKDSVTSILDPYVIVRTIGVPDDCYCFKTEAIKNNGFNPAWNHKISFSLQHPEISLILFEVRDYEKISDDVLVAQRCIRMETLMPGYRMVHLKSAAGEALLSNLLVHVSFE